MIEELSKQSKIIPVGIKREDKLNIITFTKKYLQG